MKIQDLLFVALFAIFIIQVQANGDYQDYRNWKKEFPDTCEKLFNSTSCNRCQQLMFDRFKNPGQCATFLNFGIEVYNAIKDSGETPIPYDLKFFKKGLTSYCKKGFHCSQNQVESIYKEIEDVCEKELSVKFDWGADPRTYTDMTAYSAYGTLLLYYTGIPARKALCVKDHHGDFCSYEFTKKFVAWMKKATNADPKAIVTHDHKFVITGDGKKIPVPKSFRCDPCWRKMAKFFIDYMNQHRLERSIEENIWGPDHHEFYLPKCYYKRGLAQVFEERGEALDLNKRSALPIFGVHKLHPF